MSALPVPLLSNAWSTVGGLTDRYFIPRMIRSGFVPYPTTFQRQIYPFINGFTIGHLGLTDRFFQGAVGQLSPPQSTGVTFTTGGHFYLGESGHYDLGLTNIHFCLSFFCAFCYHVGTACDR